MATGRSRRNISCTPPFTHSTLTEECADLVMAKLGAGFDRFSVLLAEP